MKIKDFKLKNGIRIILVPNENTTSVTISVSSLVGSDMENGKDSGISHLAEHMMFKGTKKRTDPLSISQEFDNLGAYYNAFTSREYTSYYAKSRPENLPEILEIISDMYQNSTFNDKELQKEKNVVVEEIRMYNDQPDSLVSLISREITFGDTPEGRSIAGSPETVLSISREKLLEFRDKYYCGLNTIVVISGNLDEEKTMSLLEKYLGCMPSGVDFLNKKDVLLDRKNQSKHLLKETEQTHVVLSFPSFKIGTQRDPVLTVLRYALGEGLSSRLSILLREELGASYYVYSNNEALSNYGIFEIGAGIKNELVREAMSGIALVLNKIKGEIISEIEMKRVIESLSGKIAISMETTDSVANYILARAAAHVKLLTPEERINEIRKVSREDVKNLANEIFKKENVKISIVGPEKSSKGVEAFLSSF